MLNYETLLTDCITGQNNGGVMWWRVSRRSLVWPLGLRLILLSSQRAMDRSVWAEGTQADSEGHQHRTALSRWDVSQSITTVHGADFYKLPLFWFWNLFVCFCSGFFPEKFGFRLSAQVFTIYTLFPFTVVLVWMSVKLRSIKRWII